MLSLGEMDQRYAGFPCITSYNYMWIHNYFRIKDLQKRVKLRTFLRDYIEYQFKMRNLYLKVVWFHYLRFTSIFEAAMTGLWFSKYLFTASWALGIIAGISAKKIVYELQGYSHSSTMVPVLQMKKCVMLSNWPKAPQSISTGLALSQTRAFSRII